MSVAQPAITKPVVVSVPPDVSVSEGSTDAAALAAGFWPAIVELAKPRITQLVTMTAGVGFVLGLVGREATPGAIALCAAGVVLGTAMSSAGANALNQWMEQHRDGLMPRTRRRPLPTGRLTPSQAFTAGIVLSIVGVLALWALSGLAAATVSAATILIYVLLYTPSKPITPANTLIGAVPGALPPLIGWCAALALGAPQAAHAFAGLWPPLAGSTASSGDGWGGWALFALMFVWQLPHFFAIAWMYKDDYAAGGHRMLSAYDPRGVLTAWTIFLTALALIPATMLPMWATPGALGWVYGAIALTTGVLYLALTIRMLHSVLQGGVLKRDPARTVFLTSILHLPVLLLAITAEALVRMIF
jgi:protoheme IX farnesyltransferase